MATAHVQHTWNLGNSTSSALASQNFGSSVTAGNTVAVIFTFNNAGGSKSVVGVNDSKSNGAYTQGFLNDAGGQTVAGYYFENITTGGTGFNVIVTLNNDAYIGMGVHEFSGAATSSSLDKFASTYAAFTNATDNAATGAQTTTTDGQYCMAVLLEINGGGISATQGTGWTSRENQSASSSLVRTESQIQSSAGSVNGTFTLSAGTTLSVGMMTFKAAGAGGFTIDSTTAGTYTLAGQATVLRPGSTTWLRYAK